MNKRTAVLLPLLLVMAVTLPAQIGLTGSLNINSICIKPDTDNSQKFKPDFSVGLVSVVPLGNALALQGELLFSHRGGKHEQSFLNGSSSITWETRLAYLELPVMLRLALPGTVTTRPALLLGGYGAWRLSAKQSVSGTYTSIKDDTEKIDYGVTAGVSLAFKVSGQRSLLLGARYIHGLANILKNPQEGQKWSNRGFSLSAGFLF